MKTIRYTLLLLTFAVGTLVRAQLNTNVHAANCLPPGDHNESFNLESSPLCFGGNLKVYYQFFVGEDVPGTPALGTVTPTSGNVSYVLYGPFTDPNFGYGQVLSGTAPIKTSSTTPASSKTVQMGGDVLAGDFYLLELTLTSCITTLQFTDINDEGDISSCDPVEQMCEDCLGKFYPTAGTYVLSAWTKEEDAPVSKTSYTYPGIELEIVDGTGTHNFSFDPTGQIIDGWQQITGTFDITGALTSFELSFVVGGSGESALFDDIRIFPFDGSMMTYVYDPNTLRLVAELDERNYAKLYEYDEEGKLVRVKKETEKGIMTITESRENSYKKP